MANKERLTHLMSPTLHLKSDTAKRPIIDLEPITWILSDGKLRRTIRPSTNTFPTIFSATETGFATIPNHANAKICDLNVSIEVDEDILRFDIAMDDSHAVESCDTNGLRQVGISLRRSPK